MTAPGTKASSARVDLLLHHALRGLDARLVEGGQHHAAVRPVVRVVGREQAVAHQRDQVAEVAIAPGEVRGAAHEHVMVGLRPEHEDDVVMQDLEREDRPVARVALEHHGQRIADEAVRSAQVERQLTGRERHRRTAVGEDVAGQQDERVGRRLRRPGGHCRRGYSRPLNERGPAGGRGLVAWSDAGGGAGERRPPGGSAYG